MTKIGIPAEATKHCECPLGGVHCCGCGKIECEEPEETSRMHEACMEKGEDCNC